MVIQLDTLARPLVQFPLCRDRAQYPLWDTKLDYRKSAIPDRLLAYGVAIAQEGGLHLRGTLTLWTSSLAQKAAAIVEAVPFPAAASTCVPVVAGSGRGITDREVGSSLEQTSWAGKIEKDVGRHLGHKPAIRHYVFDRWGAVVEADRNPG